MQKSQMIKQDERGEVKGTFRFPAEVMRDLKHLAIDKNIAVNTLVVQAVKALLAKESKK